MSNIDTLLNSYGQDSLPEAKKRNLELATAEKLKALNGISSTTFADAAVATQGTDQGSGSANEIERDIRYLSDYELRDKYGDNADYLLEQRALADIGIKNTKDLANSKTGAVAVGQDVLTSTAHGLAGLIGGLTYLGTLGADSVLGTTGSNNVAQANKAVSDWINKGHTIYNEADTKINSQQSKLNQRDTKALYDERMKAPNANSTEAWLRRVGQDFVDEVVNTGGSAEQLTNLTGEAIGSIGGIGALTKAGTKVGTKLLNSAIERELIEKGGKIATRLQKHGKDVLTTALIGATEGGSVGAEAVNRILAMDIKSLANDPVHGERIKGLIAEHGEEKAKLLLAKEVGLAVTGETAVTAAILGKMVSKFEGNPLQKLSAKQAYAALAGQAIEETLQEGSGQHITNAQIKDKLNSAQDTAEGVGSGAAKGFLGGVMGNTALTPKALATPITDPAVAVTKYLGKEVGKQVADLAKSVYTGVLGKVEGKSPVSNDSVANAASAVLPTIPAAKAVVETVINTPNATPENIKAAEYTNKLMDALVFEAPPKGVLSPLFDKEFEGVTSTIEAAQKLSKIVNDKSVSEDDRFTAIQNLHGLMTGVSDALLEGAEEALPEMEKLPELKQYADNFTALVNSFKDSPAMKSVMPHFETILETGIALGHYKEIDVNNLNDPAEQENLDNILKVATTTNGAIPEKLGDSLDKIMDMIDTNQATGITKAQKSAIIGLATEMRIGQKISEAASNMGLTNLDIVNRQIILDESASQTHTFPSAREHSRGITAALAKDNLALATQRLQTLQNFAVHLNNKVEALNKHIATAKMGTNSSVPFMGYRVKMGEEWALTPKGVYVNLNSDKSKQLAKTISLEALALTNIHNQLAKAYPELGFKSIKSIEINPIVNKGVSVNANRESIVNTSTTTSTSNNATQENTDPENNTDNIKEDINTGNSGNDNNTEPNAHVKKWVKLITHFKGLGRLNEIKKTIPTDMGERIVKVLQGLPKDFQVDGEYQDDFKEVKEYFLGKTEEKTSSKNEDNSRNTIPSSSNKSPVKSKTPEYLDKWGKLLTYFKGLGRLNEVKKDISTELGERVVKVLESLPKDFQVDEEYQDDFNEIKEYFLGKPEEETTSIVSGKNSKKVSIPSTKSKITASNYPWARTADNSYEVSSAGDTRFSALVAKLADGRTIEEAYQLDVKGYRSQGNDWKLGKGKPPIRNITKEQQWEEYKDLWRTYLKENPELLKDLREKAKGKTLTDKFASTDISQARALSELLNEKEAISSSSNNNNDNNTTDENPSNEVITAKGKMTFSYGDQKRKEVTSENTFDAIKKGERTATTRYESDGHTEYWKKLKVGDVIEWASAKGEVIKVNITKPLHKLTDDLVNNDQNALAENWSKKEGWSVEYFNKKVAPKLNEAWQIEYTYENVIQEATEKLTEKPKLVEKSSKNSSNNSIKTGRTSSSKISKNTESIDINSDHVLSPDHVTAVETLQGTFDSPMQAIVVSLYGLIKRSPKNHALMLQALETTDPKKLREILGSYETPQKGLGEKLEKITKEVYSSYIHGNDSVIAEVAKTNTFDLNFSDQNKFWQNLLPNVIKEIAEEIKAIDAVPTSEEMSAKPSFNQLLSNLTLGTKSKVLDAFNFGSENTNNLLNQTSVLGFVIDSLGKTEKEESTFKAQAKKRWRALLAEEVPNIVNTLNGYVNSFLKDKVPVSERTKLSSIALIVANSLKEKEPNLTIKTILDNVGITKDQLEIYTNYAKYEGIIRANEEAIKDLQEAQEVWNKTQEKIKLKTKWEYVELLQSREDELAKAKSWLAENSLDEALTKFRTDLVKVQGEIPLHTLMELRELHKTPNGKLMNFLAQENGSYYLDLRVAESIAIAGISWIAGNATSGVALDRKELAEALGVGVWSVPKDALIATEKSVFSGIVIQGIADSIRKTLNLIEKQNGYIGDTQGILLSLSANVVEALKDNGLLDLQTVNITDKETKKVQKSFNYYRATPLVGTIYSAVSEVIEDTVVEESLKTPRYTVGSPQKLPVSNKVKHSSVTLTHDQKNMVQTANRVPTFVNLPIYNFFKAIGVDGLVKLFAHGELNEDLLHPEDYISKLGKNRSISAAWEKAEVMLKDITNAASTQEKEVEQVPVYFSKSVNSAGRLDFDEAYSIQSSKVNRPVFVATRKEVDLTNSTNKVNFLRGIAQGMGVKIHNLSAENSLAKLQEIVETPEVVNALKLIGEHKEVFTEEDIDVLKAAMPFVDNTEWGLTNLVEYQRYLETPEKDLNKFTTPVAIEADGATNGTANSLHLLANKITTRLIQLWKMTGFFVGSSPRSLNEEREVNPTDIYLTVAKAVSEYLPKYKQEFYKNQPTELQPAYEGGEALIRLLNITVTVNSAGNIELSRASAKNPVTVAVYRSGVNGIAEKVTGELAKELYSQISLRLQGTGNLMIPSYYEELVNAFKLIDETIKLPAFDASNAAWQAFTLDGVNFALITEAVKYAYAQPLYKVISNEVLGTVNLAANVMVKIANMQGALIKEAYERAIREKIEYKLKNEPSYRRSDYLTNKELKDISADIIKRFGGVINDNYQNATVFMKSVKSSVAGMPHTAASLQDTAKAYPSIETFEEPGVSIVPNSVIRGGDGLMVQHFINDPENDIDNLPIFDGIMVNIADIEKASLLANKAVYRTWTEGTPMEAVVTAFEKALSAVDFDKISTEAANAITNASGLNKSELKDTTVRRILEDALALGKGIVIDIKAQQELIKRLPSSTDQMASVGNPHYSEGSSELSEKLIKTLSDNPSEEELAKALEEERASIAAELRKATRTKKEDNSLSDTPSKSELVVLDSTNVVEELKRLANKDSQYSKLMGVAESVVNAFKQTTYTILRGDSKDVHDYLMKIGDTENAKHVLENNKGFINHTKRLIVTKGEEFIVLLHEMIHASVSHSLSIGLNTKDPKTSAEKRAVSSVKQIKVMFSEFVSDEFVEHFKNDAKALDVYLAIKTALLGKYKDDEYIQLNEFLAHVLGNNRMLNILSNIPTKATIASKFLEGIRKAIARFFEWSNNSPESKDFFSTLVFHATTLAHDNLLFNDLKSTLPTNDYELGSRLDTLRTKLKDKFKERMAASTVVDKTILTNNLLKERKLADDIIAAGFYLDQEELNLYSAMNLAMQIGLDTNAVARTQLQDVFAKILQNITVEHFYPNDNPTQNEKDIAANKLHAVFGRYQGGGSIRQDTLANFVSLATVSPELQKIINEIAIKEFNLADDTKDAFDTWVGNLGNKVIDSISDYSSKVDKTYKTRDVYFNSLVDVLFNAEQDNKLQNNALLKEVSANTDKMNSWLADNIQKSGQKINELSEPLRNSNNRFAKFTGDVVRSLNAIVNKDIAEVAVQDINKDFNRKEGFQEFRDLLRDLFGRTEDNARVYDLVKPIRTYVDKVRQAYKGTVPVIIKQKFTKPVTKEEYSILSTAMGKTALNTLGSSNLIRLVTGKLKASDRIAQLENKLSSLNSDYFVGVQAKAKQLAKYNIEGVVGDMLLRNPYTIAHRFDGYTGSSPTITSAYVDSVAELVSLYSYELLPESHKEVLNKLGQQDPDALIFVNRFLDSIRSQEKESLEVNLTAKVNSYFGHLPQLIESEGHLRIADDTEFTNLVTQGYTRVGDYVGDSRDPLRTKSRGYYYNPLDTGVEYKQGIIQNIQGSAAGVDLETGLTVSKLSAGLITDPTEIKRILNSKYKESDESLLPVYNGQKQLIAFERTVSNKQLDRLKLTTDLPTLLGAMRGRQAEGSLAKIFLTMSLDALADTYKNDPDKSQYVDLFDEKEVGKDKVLEFSVSLFSRFAKDEIRRRFGDSFYVKREMLTDVVGFRKASVTDIFTGVSRYSPETVKTLRAIALSVFGENAYKYLVYSEKYIQEGVSFIKGNIIVRSVVVPVANIMSNALHLLSLGIPLQYTLKAIPKKIAELEHYSKAKTRLMAIEIEMDAANKNDSVLFKRLIAEKKSLESTLQRMTIAPLILAGELSNINDVGLGEEDKLLFSRHLGEYFSKLLDKTPKGVKVVGKHLMLAEDTALYAGLQKSVLYGDFIAKAIQYDFLTQVRKVNSKDAVVTVSSEFISYDHLPGRGRDYLESMGLLWFYNYKLRSLRVALNAIRNNPLYSILFGGILGSQLNIDSPLDSNIVSQTFDGTVGNSLGIGMGIDGVFSNPYVNLIT